MTRALRLLGNMFRNREPALRGGSEIRIGIGIASGPVIAGFTGTERRVTYTCVGDTVNLAAHLEAHTKVVGRPILIDCCPILGVLSLNAIFASDRVLIPVSADWLAVKGVWQVEKTLKALEHVFKKRVARRYVITRFDSRRRMSHDIYTEIKQRYCDELCNTQISESVSVADSPASNEDVFAPAPESRGAQDYDALLEELIETGFLP